jgi:hypothetical protein
MKRRRLLKRLAQGAVQNVAFGDMRDLVEAFGFTLRRIDGSHHIVARAWRNW